MPETRVQHASDLQSRRLRAGRLSLAAGIAIFAGKFSAYLLTGSSAIFADALESTVNIVSAGVLLFALTLAAKPPDRDHPYGHGRVEFLSASIEGAAITFAALLILAESIHELIRGPELGRLDLGLGVLAFFSLLNGILGRHLVQVGQETDSIALIADGRHILADVWTSVGVIGGLIFVRLTGYVWADPVIAIVVALNVAREGVLLLRSSIGNLMDEAEVETLGAVVEILESQRDESWIDAHSLRSWRSGARRHIDLHLTVPRYFDVEQIHAIHDKIEAALLSNDLHGGDAVVHFDPCDASLCTHCNMRDCKVRTADFESRIPFTTDLLTRTDDQLGRDETPPGDTDIG